MVSYDFCENFFGKKSIGEAGEEESGRVPNIIAAPRGSYRGWGAWRAPCRRGSRTQTHNI